MSENTEHIKYWGTHSIIQRDLIFNKNYVLYKFDFVNRFVNYSLPRNALY